MDLNNTKTAFCHLSDKELRRNRFVFGLIRRPILTKMLTKIAKNVVEYNLPLKFLIRKTVYNVFCAGESGDVVLQKMAEMHLSGVNSVLDYVAEGENSEECFSQNLDKILINIELCDQAAPGQFIGVKPSSLTDCEKLKSYGEENLSLEEICEKVEIIGLVDKMTKICERAKAKGVYVYFDAEEFLTQGYFDSIVKSLMKQFNKKDVVVFNTLQLYMKDRIEYLQELIEEFESENIKLGVKLVRGAYLEQERELAKIQNRPSPVYNEKFETDEAYDHAVHLCLKNNQFVYTCLATHNKCSIELGVRLIQDLNIHNHYSCVFFSQLYGMSDNLTYNLAKFHYNSSKYIPYGELTKAIPYLIRRADENTAMNDQSGREYELLNEEYKRRKKRD